MKYGSNLGHIGVRGRNLGHEARGQSQGQPPLYCLGQGHFKFQKSEVSPGGKVMIPKILKQKAPEYSPMGTSPPGGRYTIPTLHSQSRIPTPKGLQQKVSMEPVGVSHFLNLTSPPGLSGSDTDQTPSSLSVSCCGPLPGLQAIFHWEFQNWALLSSFSALTPLRTSVTPSRLSALTPLKTPSHFSALMPSRFSALVPLRCL